MDRENYKRLNISEMNIKNKKRSIQDALQDVTPMPWKKEVISGEKRIVISRQR